VTAERGSGGADKSLRILRAVPAKGRRFDADHAAAQPEGVATAAPTPAT
jgi:hypothetical protein